MVVLWCRSCGALIGLREPLVDWTTDNTGLCPSCAGKMLRDKGPAETQEEAARDVKEETTGEGGEGEEVTPP
jgi:hypothetical protein